MTFVFRINNKSILTPQGEFDLNPAEYIEKYMDTDEFEYLGEEEVSQKILTSSNRTMV